VITTGLYITLLETVAIKRGRSYKCGDFLYLKFSEIFIYIVVDIILIIL
jgi:hypothetical protein